MSWSAEPTEWRAATTRQLKTTQPPARSSGLRRLLPGRRTMRLRLTLWYVAVLALSTGVIAVLFYVGLETALRNQVDRGIQETAASEAKTSVGDFLQNGPEQAPDEASSESMIRVLGAKARSSAARERSVCRAPAGSRGRVSRPCRRPGRALPGASTPRR